MASLQLILGETSYEVPISTIVATCGKFANNPNLLEAPYRVESPVSPVVFECFLEAINGKDLTPTPKNVADLAKLGKEFGFKALSDLRSQSVRCVLIGLEDGGKTCILRKLYRGECGSTVPTTGCNERDFDYKSVNWTLTDIGGELRMLWRLFYNRGAQGLIFVVDSNDADRIDEAREELHKLLDVDVLKDTVLLVYANKQDLPGAIKPQGLVDLLKLESVTNRAWHIQGTCAMTGDGLYEGLDWVLEQINKKS
jgi:small GTP-binding protein